MLGLSLPILIAFAAEPLTGLADTAFVARLGTEPVAALGIATALLTSLLWIFNFLAIGTQTEVAMALGAGRRDDARASCAAAIALSLSLGVALAVAGWPLAPAAGRLMAAADGILVDAISYLRIRLLGAPAVLVTLAAFGALRGLQDMTTPLRVSLVLHGLNIVLDATLIFGLGPFPDLGLQGAALATVLAQWLGAGLATAAVGRSLGFSIEGAASRVRGLVVVGRDLFARTGLLLLFTLAATRVATQAGAETAAAHQAARQLWIFSAFVLDALGATAQSLVGFYRGAGRIHLARKVAGVCCAWGFGLGGLLSLALIGTSSPVAVLLVPTEARGLFASAWMVVAAAQPLNALSFVTDGIHWGTGDYRYLRNAMLISTGLGVVLLLQVDTTAAAALRNIWWATAIWMLLRSAAGVVRIWPGSRAAPLGRV